MVESLVDDERMADVTDALRSRGFEFTNRDREDGWFLYRGALESDGKSYPCELRVDRHFSEYPYVRLLERPPGLPPVVPHLGADSNVCYLAKGTVALDIFDPAGQTIACLERAEVVLASILKGELIGDLEEEFYAHWAGEFCLTDLNDERLGEHTTFVVQNGRSIYAVVTDDAERTKAKVKTLGWPVTDVSMTTYRVKTTAKPRPHSTTWPIQTVQQLLEWQGLLDQNCRRKILERLEQARATGVGGVAIIIESPLMTYGVCVDFEWEIQKALKQEGKPSKALFALPAQPLQVVRIDDRYSSRRNTPGSKTLEGKRLVLVGCGTIGGYLADLLVKAGAGTGGGKLVLVDFDGLMPQNLGRHRLGFANLFVPKAVALKREFERSAPGASVSALACDAKEAQLGDFDLLIDATGEESLGHWLAHRYKQAQMLSLWIEGPGVAIRGLLRRNAEGACFRCLCDANRGGALRTIEGEMPKLLAGQGCEGLYVPFPATVSVQAAALGAEMVSAWVNDLDAPALRTRILDGSFRAATLDCAPLRFPGCPACSS